MAKTWDLILKMQSFDETERIEKEHQFIRVKVIFKTCKKRYKKAFQSLKE